MKKKFRILVLIFMAAGCALNGTAFADLQEGLVAHYKFDGNAMDSSGNANDAVENGGVTYTTGLLGQSVQLDGIDDFIKPAYPNLNVQSFSFCCWVKQEFTNDYEDDIGPAGSNIFSGRTGRTSSIIYLSTEFESRGGPEVFTQIMGFEGEPRPEIDTDINLIDNQWHFVAITSSTTTFSLYIDGNLVGSDSQTTSGFLTDEALIAAMSNRCGNLPGCSYTLNGTVNPNGMTASYFFEYGSSDRYGSFTPTRIAGSGTADIPVSAYISPLSRDTTYHYHYRLVASNGAMDVNGDDRTFTTLEAPTIADSKVIIVAGGGPYAENSIWDQVEMLSSYAYSALIHQRYTEDTIYYLSSNRELKAQDVYGYMLRLFRM